MRRMGIAGSCLLVLLVACMALAGGASAATPEFKVCVKAPKVNKKTTGKYTTAGCNVEEPKGEGKYERASWEHAKKKKKKGKGVKGKKSVFLIINPGESENYETKTTEVGKVESELECESEKSEGEVTGAQTEVVKQTFKKCKVKALKSKNPPYEYEIQGECNSAGAKPGEVKTEELEGTLVFVNSAKTAVGLRMKPKSGTSIATIECVEGLVNDKPSGEFIVQRLGDANVASKDTETIAAAGTMHGQDPYYEEEAHSEAEGFTYFDFGYCVEEEEAKGLKTPEAEAACAVKLGGPPPPAPASRIAHISGAKTATAPETAVTTTEEKGEAFMIET